MTQPTFIYIDDHGQHQVARLVTPTHRLNVGPPWPTPRKAIEYAKRLDEGAGVSPLPTPRTAQESAPARSGSPDGSRQAPSGG